MQNFSLATMPLSPPHMQTLHCDILARQLLTTLEYQQQQAPYLSEALALQPRNNYYTASLDVSHINLNINKD